MGIEQFEKALTAYCDDYAKNDCTFAAKYQMGAKMHHCVFQCKYYNKNDSLILSAKDINGNRLATIELSLIDWNILQCRGVDNSRPSQYDEIVSLVNNNIGQFQQAKLKLAS